MVRAALVLLCGVVALSCGRRTVELSTPPHLEPSSLPTVVGSINEQVGWLTVDDERLYWSGRYGILNLTDDNTGAALHSCSKSRCSATLTTYDASRLDTRSAFSVQNGDIYWIQLKSGTGPSSYQLVTCPVIGCDGAPRVVYVSEVGDLYDASFGPNAIYFAAPTDTLQISRFPFSGGLEPQLVAQSIDPVESLTVNGDYIYSFTRSQGSGVMLNRARTDGSGPFELVAKNLKILSAAQEWNTTLSPYVNLAFDDTYVYWTSNTLSGSIQRCPLSGCVNSPEVLTPPTRAPTALRLDGSMAYFQYFDTQLGNALTSCTLAHCQPSAAIAYGLDDGNVVAIDDQYVYTASRENQPAPDATWDFPAAQIRRFPK